MEKQLKYGRIERERRWLLESRPQVTFDRQYQVEDRYITGTRLRLRKMDDLTKGATAYKLARKLPPSSPGVSVMGNLYLSQPEYNLMLGLPAAKIEKRLLYKGQWRVDVFGGHLSGLVLCEREEDDPTQLAALVPPWPTLGEVTADEAYTGARLAHEGLPPNQTSQSEETDWSNRRFCIRIAGNTGPRALMALRQKGYSLRHWVVEQGPEQHQFVFEAKQGDRLFSATSPEELLGLVGIWETRGDDWSEATEQEWLFYRHLCDDPQVVDRDEKP